LVPYITKSEPRNFDFTLKSLGRVSQDIETFLNITPPLQRLINRFAMPATLEQNLVLINPIFTGKNDTRAEYLFPELTYAVSYLVLQKLKEKVPDMATLSKHMRDILTPGAYWLKLPLFLATTNSVQLQVGRFEDAWHQKFTRHGSWTSIVLDVDPTYTLEDLIDSMVKMICPRGLHPYSRRSGISGISQQSRRTNKALAMAGNTLKSFDRPCQQHFLQGLPVLCSRIVLPGRMITPSASFLLPSAHLEGRFSAHRHPLEIVWKLKSCPEN
jgi:hypothetical protein